MGIRRRGGVRAATAAVAVLAVITAAGCKQNLMAKVNANDLDLVRDLVTAVSPEAKVPFTAHECSLDSDGNTSAYATAEVHLPGDPGALAARIRDTGIAQGWRSHRPRNGGLVVLDRDFGVLIHGTPADGGLQVSAVIDSECQQHVYIPD